MGTHFCGLLNRGGFSHLNAALQMLLHIPEVLAFLDGDQDHRKSCRSLLCLTCALYAVLNNLRGAKSVVPSFFVDKWSRTAQNLPESKKCDAHEAVFLLLTGLRLEHVQRRKNLRHTTLGFYDTITSKLFVGQQVKEALCQICGPQSRNQEFLSVELEVLGRRVPSSDIRDKLWESQEELCPSCQRLNVTWKLVTVRLPPYLIVRASHCRVTAAEFMSVTVENEVYQFVSCIHQTSNSPLALFTCAFPDGLMRQIEDVQVKRVNPATFQFGGIPMAAAVTILFQRKAMQSSQSTESSQSMQKTGDQGLKSLKLNAGHQRKQVLVFPRIGDPKELMAGISLQRSIGTQTDPIQVDSCEVGVQNDLIDFGKLKIQDKCDFRFWTGINAEDFEALYNLMGGDDVVMNLKQKYRLDTPKKKNVASRISGRNRLLLFLLRFRQGLTFEQIGFIFKLSVSYASELFFVMTGLVYQTLESMSKHMFVSAKEQQKGKPRVMKPFKNLRVILDGVSINIETPSNFEQQGNTWSSYKHHNVVLFIVGVSCQAATIFCSEGMEGSMSDKVATVKANLLELLEDGDAVMTDKGFELQAEMEAIGCKILRPPVKRRDRFFTKEEEKMTRAIAAARIYVEHAMADIQDNRLLRGTIPLTMLPLISKLVFIGAFLRNFNPSRIHNVSFSAAKAGGTSPDEIEDLIFNT